MFMQRYTLCRNIHLKQGTILFLKIIPTGGREKIKTQVNKSTDHMELLLSIDPQNDMALWWLVLMIRAF